MTSMFSWVNRVDSASMLAGDQSAGLPVSNLADRIVQKVYRSGNSYSTYFEIDFGSAVPLQLLALFGCTLESSDTVRHRLSAISPGAGELLDTGTIASNVDNNFGTHGYRLNSAVSPRYWRCDVVATSRSTFGYFDIGRAWAGEIWEPGIGFSTGWGDGFIDTSEVYRSRHSGVTFPSEGATYRRVECTFDFLDEADKTVALTIDRISGKRGQIAFFPDTSIMPSGLVGRMTESQLLTQPMPIMPPRFNRAYVIEQDH